MARSQRIVPFVFMLIGVVGVTGGVAAHPGRAEAKDGTPHGEPTVVTTVPSWPKPQIHTITKNNDGVEHTPDNIDYWWHGTIDGRECILVDQDSHPALSCNFNGR